MAFTNPWDETVPQGSDAANEIEKFIQNVKIDVRERIETVLPGWTDDLEDPKVFPGWLLRKTDTVLLAAVTNQKVSWTTEDRDTDGFITVPSSVVTIPAGLGGLYLLGFAVGWESSGDGGIRDAALFINGSSFGTDRRAPFTGDSVYCRLGMRLALLSATDTVEVNVFHTSAASESYGNVDANSQLVYLFGLRLGA